MPHHRYTTKLNVRYDAVTKPMQTNKALWKSLGCRISAMTGMNAEVPADETKILSEATIPPANVVCAIA